MGVWRVFPFSLTVTSNVKVHCFDIFVSSEWIQVTLCNVLTLQRHVKVFLSLDKVVTLHTYATFIMTVLNFPPCFNICIFLISCSFCFQRCTLESHSLAEPFYFAVSCF